MLPFRAKMLPFEERGSGEIALVMMPFLGGSQREWTEVAAALSKEYCCVTMDLPGFGAAADLAGYSVDAMSDALAERLTSLELGRYVFVGHSMAGKVMAVATRRLLANQTAGPEALILVAPSPPGPEPMSDEKRSEMLASLGNESQRRRGRYLERDRPAAIKFVRDNIAGAIAADAFERTVDDVLAMNPEAWVAWLERGSKEDWAEFVGVLELPAMIVAGTKDAALGPEAQRAKTLPHFRNCEVKEVDCSHLIPLERAAELAAIISEFVERVDGGVSS